MKTIYAIDYADNDEKFCVVEIPVIKEDEFDGETYYYVDYDNLDDIQRRAIYWNRALAKIGEGIYNWTTDKEQFEEIKRHFASKIIKQIQRQIIVANERLNKTLESAYLIGALED